MRNRSTPIRVATVSIACLFGLLAVGSQTGCYEHVVGVEGIGSGVDTIYEPNLKNPDDSFQPKQKTAPSKTIPTKRAPDQ